MARPRIRPLPSIEALKATFRYDPTTGNIYRRPKDGLPTFNKRYCVKPIGTVMNAGYLFVSFGRDMVLGHRLAWVLHYGEWPELEIDHKDGDKTNNAIANLRSSSRTQNVQNQMARTESGYKGVKLSKDCASSWSARIRLYGKSVNLGSFPTVELAAEAYARADRKRSGEFAFHPIGKIVFAISITAANI